MKTTHTITIKAAGRDTSLIVVSQSGSRFDVECLDIGPETPDDRHIANAVTVAISKCIGSLPSIDTDDVK